MKILGLLLIILFAAWPASAQDYSSSGSRSSSGGFSGPIRSAGNVFNKAPTGNYRNAFSNRSPESIARDYGSGHSGSAFTGSANRYSNSSADDISRRQPGSVSGNSGVKNYDALNRAAENRPFIDANNKQQYSSRVSITPKSLKSGQWGPGLGRARVDWSKLPTPSAGRSGGSAVTNCANCGHYKAPGVSWCTSCGR